MKHSLIFGLLILTSFVSFGQQVLSFQDKPIIEPALTDTAVLNFNKSQTGYNDLNNSEKEFYYLVNYSRSKPGEFFTKIISPLLSEFPQLAGSYSESLQSDLHQVSKLPFLRLNSKLLMMAKEHALDITSTNAKPSHNSSNGESFGSRAQKYGIRKCAGENISFGKNQPVFLLALLYLDINMPSLGHRKALLNPNFLETGIASSFFANKSVFFVQDFSCPQD